MRILIKVLYDCLNQLYLNFLLSNKLSNFVKVMQDCTVVWCTKGVGLRKRADMWDIKVSRSVYIVFSMVLILDGNSDRVAYVMKETSSSLNNNFSFVTDLNKCLEKL